MHSIKVIKNNSVRNTLVYIRDKNLKIMKKILYFIKTYIFRISSDPQDQFYLDLIKKNKINIGWIKIKLIFYDLHGFELINKIFLFINRPDKKISSKDNMLSTIKKDESPNISTIYKKCVLRFNNHILFQFGSIVELARTFACLHGLKEIPHDDIITFLHEKNNILYIEEVLDDDYHITSIFTQKTISEKKMFLLEICSLGRKLNCIDINAFIFAEFCYIFQNRGSFFTPEVAENLLELDLADFFLYSEDVLELIHLLNDSHLPILNEIKIKLTELVYYLPRAPYFNLLNNIFIF